MEKFKTFTLLFTGEVRGDRSRLLLSLLSNIFLNHPESFLDPQNMFCICFGLSIFLINDDFEVFIFC